MIYVSYVTYKMKNFKIKNENSSYLYFINNKEAKFLTPYFFRPPSPNYSASLFLVWNWKTTTQHHSS
jgi:hypothetical protein